MTQKAGVLDSSTYDFQVMSRRVQTGQRRALEDFTIRVGTGGTIALHVDLGDGNFVAIATTLTAEEVILVPALHAERFRLTGSGSFAFSTSLEIKELG